MLGLDNTHWRAKRRRRFRRERILPDHRSHQKYGIRQPISQLDFEVVCAALQERVDEQENAVHGGMNKRRSVERVQDAGSNSDLYGDEEMRLHRRDGTSCNKSHSAASDLAIKVLILVVVPGAGNAAEDGG